jgi:protein TonB
MKMTGESLDELVFENRNKAYGAYVIRKEYAESLKIGFFVTYAFVAVLVLCSFVMKTGEVIKEVVMPAIDDTTGIVVDIPHPPVPDLPPVPQKPAGGPKITSIIPVVVYQIVETPPTAPPDIPTAPNVDGPPTGPPAPPTSGDPGPELPAAPPVESQAVMIADKMPEMEGDVMKFLKRNLIYPDRAVEKGTKGKVFMSFVVEKDGSVSNIQVLKGIGDGCEEEATRVIKKMKWKPGENHGHPVRVLFHLPITFTINE